MGTTSRRSSRPAMGGLLVLLAEEALEERVAGLAEPELAVGVDVRGVHAEVAAVGRLGGDEVEAGEQVDGVGERLGDAGDLAAEAAEDAADLAVLLALEDGALGAEAGDAGRLDEDRLAGGAGAVDDALDLVAVVDGDGQDVVVAADGGVGVAEDLREGRGRGAGRG